MNKIIILLISTCALFVSCGHVTLQTYNQLATIKKGTPLNSLSEEFKDGDAYARFDVQVQGKFYTIVPAMVQTSRIHIVNLASRGPGATGMAARTYALGADEFYLVYENNALMTGDFLYRLKNSENEQFRSIGSAIESKLVEVTKE